MYSPVRTECSSYSAPNTGYLMSDKTDTYLHLTKAKTLLVSVEQLVSQSINK